MLQVQAQGFYRWFKFLTFLTSAVLTLQCCGSGLTRGGATGLELSLEIPQGEDPSLFWYGVNRKILRLKSSRGGSQEVDWNSGTNADWDLREGDKIEFLGVDNAGRTVIAGEVEVSKEKKVTIPIRRVL